MGFHLTRLPINASQRLHIYDRQMHHRLTAVPQRYFNQFGNDDQRVPLDFKSLPCFGHGFYRLIDRLGTNRLQLDPTVRLRSRRSPAQETAR